MSSLQARGKISRIVERVLFKGLMYVRIVEGFPTHAHAANGRRLEEGLPCRDVLRPQPALRCVADAIQK